MLPRPPGPPLRAPSPLGLYDDGVSEGPVNRSASAPPVGPTLIRALSPGSASTPLRPPVQTARRASYHELEKIDCGELLRLIQRTVGENQRVGRALVIVLSKVSKSWTIPQRAVRAATKEIVHQLCQNSHELMSHLRSVSLASRKILNFIATCIKETHGLRDFSALQPLKPVIDELTLLSSNFTSLISLSTTFSNLLHTHSNTFEKGMEPDDWMPGSGESDECRSVREGARGVRFCYEKVRNWLGELAVGEWKPPLLSPEDVKAAAKKWKDIELGSLKSVADIRTSVKVVIDMSQSGGFINKEDWELAHLILHTGQMKPNPAMTSAAGQGDKVATNTFASSSKYGMIPRSQTTMGYR